MTGVAATPEPDEPLSAFAALERPAVLLVGDPVEEAEACEKILEGVFQAEKICSGMRAFEALQITPEKAALDPLLKAHTRTVPCVLVLDPVKERIVELTKPRIKVSKLWTAMRAAARHAWKESLNRTVRAHLRLLVQRDRLHDARCVLADRISREDATGKRAQAEQEMQALDTALAELRKEESALWKLTPKWEPPSVTKDPARNPLAPQLPDGWKERKTSDGKTYYEAPDGTTTWTRPSVD